MTKSKIKIDIISDIVCPWCYIGKRRLEKAIHHLSGEYQFEVNYHPFQLNPNVPKEGLNQKEYLVKKFGGIEKYNQIVNNVSAVAASEGLAFDFKIQMVSPNTIDAHRIIWLAGKENKQAETVEAFFKAYFERGVDLSKTENLLAVAKEVGLNESAVNQLLQSDEGFSEVQEQQQYYRSLGATGVPLYIINDKYSVSGAQPAEVFIEALPQIASEMKVEGPSCDVDGNC